MSDLVYIVEDDRSAYKTPVKAASPQQALRIYTEHFIHVRRATLVEALDTGRSGEVVLAKAPHQEPVAQASAKVELVVTQPDPTPGTYEELIYMTKAQ